MTGGRLTEFCGRLMARTGLQRANRFLFNVSLRGLGILNYRDLTASGEVHFLEKLLASYDGPGVERAGVILDVGANVGAYSRAILNIAPAAQVYCFEPHPANVRRLETALGDRVTIVPAAVGSSAGSVALYDYAGEGGSSHASLYKDVFEKLRRQAHESLNVAMITIDDFVQQRGINAITLLKVDVEGHELEVFRGASRVIEEQRVDAVQFEFNEMSILTKAFLGDFFAILPGFSFYRLLPHGWIPVTDHPVENVFAFQNIVGVRQGTPPFRVFAGR